MDTETFKKQLIALRETTLADIANAKGSAQTVELDQTSVGRLSRMDAMQQQEMVKAGQQRRKAMIGKIDAALRRIESEDFGYCTNCDEEIAPKRLRLDPTVLTCIKCAEA